MAKDSPRVFVNTIEWEESALLTFDATNQFEIEYGFNPPRLQFGDGIAGNIPPTDADIRLRYVATSGPAGFVQANTVVSFQEPLVAGTETLSATLVHNQPSSPGSARESIESIRVNAPLVVQAADRAVTQVDLDGLINAFIDPIFGAVAIGRATVPRSVDQDAQALTIIAQLEAENVSADVVQELRDYWDAVLSSNSDTNVVVAQILAADSVGRYISAPVGLARALETFLDARAESTVKVVVVDGAINLYSVDLTCELRLQTGFQNDLARASVFSNVVSTLEGALLGRAYAESLRISDLYALIEAVEGVEFSHISVTGINGVPPNIGALNAFGDLEIEDFEVITLGVAPIVTEI